MTEVPNTDSETERQPRVKPYQSKETLERLYFEQGLSQYDIADRFGISQPTVSYWFDQYDIRGETQNFYRVEKPDGKLQLQTPSGETVYCHQVVALQDYSISEVFHEDTHVHHLMGSGESVDLPENLDVLHGGEHVRRHAEGTATEGPEKVLQHVFGEFELEIGSPNSDHRATTLRLRHWGDRIQVNTSNGTSATQADD